MLARLVLLLGLTSAALSFTPPTTLRRPAQFIKSCDVSSLAVSAPLLSNFNTHKRSVRGGSHVGGLRCSMDGFMQWLETNGAKVNCIALDGSGGRGLKAKKALKAGEEACSIPIKLMMTEETAKKALGSKAEEVDAETAIALQLIKEKSAGDSSFYAPWISVLPSKKTIDVPLFWSEEDRELLAGSQVEENLEELSDSLADEFTQLKSTGWESVLPSGSFTLDEYKWATSVVSSRSFDAANIPGGVAFAPLADFAGHSISGGTADVTFEGMFREPHIKIRAGAAVPSGGAVTVNYGESNPEQVFKRGMADLDVIKGSYELSFGVSPMDRFRDDKEDILEQAGFATQQLFRITSDQLNVEEVPQSYWDMLAYLRLVCIANTDAFLLESVFRNDVWGFMQYPVSLDNEKLMLDTLVGYCEGALDGYDTSDAQDAKTQSNGGLPLRERMAAAAKLGEKKVLSQSLKVYLDELDSLKDKEYYQERRLRELNLDRPLDESEIVDPDIAIRPENVEY